jgi:hypothetical protein
VSRKNRLHVYDQANGQIFVVTTYPAMSVLELQSVLARMTGLSKFYLMAHGRVLEVSQTLSG